MQKCAGRIPRRSSSHGGPNLPTGQGPDIPEYQPSTVVSKATGSTVLHSPDPVNKVSAVYLDFVDKSGWQTVSKSTTPFSTSLTIKESGKGASISVAPAPGGTVISISTYPTH